MDAADRFTPLIVDLGLAPARSWRPEAQSSLCGEVRADMAGGAASGCLRDDRDNLHRHSQRDELCTPNRREISTADDTRL